MPSTDPETPVADAPLSASYGVLVHTRRDRELAASMWLLLSSADSVLARREWREIGVTLLRCGRLFSAVRIPSGLVHAAAGTDDHRDVSTYLAEVLDGGPVFHDCGNRRYYVLTPSSLAYRWRSLDTACLGPNHFLGVPATDLTEPDPRIAAYWSVPMSGPAVLCTPHLVGRLVTAGHAATRRETEDDA